MAPKDPIASLEKIEQAIIAKAIQAVNRTGRKVEEKLLREHMSGPGDNSLAKRTGAAARSIHLDPAAAGSRRHPIAAKLSRRGDLCQGPFRPPGQRSQHRPDQGQDAGHSLGRGQDRSRGGPGRAHLGHLGADQSVSEARPGT